MDVCHAQYLVEQLVWSPQQSLIIHMPISSHSVLQSPSLFLSVDVSPFFVSSELHPKIFDLLDRTEWPSTWTIEDGEGIKSWRCKLVLWFQKELSDQVLQRQWKKVWWLWEKEQRELCLRSTKVCNAFYENLLYIQSLDRYICIRRHFQLCNRCSSTCSILWLIHDKSHIQCTREGKQVATRKRKGLSQQAKQDKNIILVWS